MVINRLALSNLRKYWMKAWPSAFDNLVTVRPSLNDLASRYSHVPGVPDSSLRTQIANNALGVLFRLFASFRMYPICSGVIGFDGSCFIIIYRPQLPLFSKSQNRIGAIILAFYCMTVSVGFRFLHTNFFTDSVLDFSTNPSNKFSANL